LAAQSLLWVDSVEEVSDRIELIVLDDL